MGNRSFSILQYRLCVPIAEKEEKYGAEIEKLIVKLFLLEAERMGVTYKSHYFEKDCVVFTFLANTRLELAKFICAYKTLSSRQIRKLYEFSWVSTYFVCSLGDSDIVAEQIQNFIGRQNKQRKKG